jgi:hypothetical protein
MTEVPKIVHDRLRDALPEQTHPDADLLTAFAEQTLSASERDGILHHLALCGDCRDVIALALPAADVVPPQTADEDRVRTTVSRAGAPAPHKLSFAWPTLRWAALAAGVVVAGAVLLMHPRKLNQATLPSANRQVATTAQPASGSRTGSSLVASPVPSSQIPSPLADQSAVLAKSYEPRPKSELQLSNKLKAGQVVTPTPQAESGILLADNNKKESRPADNLPAAPSAGARVLDYKARTSPEATETVEVSGAAAAVTTEPSTDYALMARNNAPPKDAPAIEKAKPALQDKGADEKEQKSKAATVPGPAGLQARNVISAARLASTATESVAPHVTWTITGGVLQRSLDGGQNWQDALHADHPLLCYASHNEDVWTGGQAGILFRSANSGVTWVQVQPSIKGRQLGSDVTHIEVRDEVQADDLRGNVRDDVPGSPRGPAEIIVSTSTNEIWSSADAGKTWDKK